MNKCRRMKLKNISLKKKKKKANPRKSSKFGLIP